MSRASFTQDVKCSVAGEFPFLRGSVLHFSVECTGESESEDFGQESLHACVLIDLEPPACAPEWRDIQIPVLTG